MCSVWDGLGLAFISQQTHSNFSEIQDLGNVTHWHLPPLPQSRLLVSPEQEKSRRKAGPHMAVLVLLSTPLRSTSLSSYSPHRSQSHHHDWSTSHLSSLQGERGLALKNTVCGKAYDAELVFEKTITKTPLSPLQTVYNHKTTSVCLWVHETILQEHNSECIYLTIFKNTCILDFSKVSGDSPSHVPLVHSAKCCI